MNIFQGMYDIVSQEDDLLQEKLIHSKPITNSAAKTLISSGIQKEYNAQQMHEFLENNAYSLEESGIQEWILVQTSEYVPPVVCGDIAVIKDKETNIFSYSTEKHTFHLIFPYNQEIQNTKKEVSLHTYDIIYL